MRINLADHRNELQDRSSFFLPSNGPESQTVILWTEPRAFQLIRYKLKNLQRSGAKLTGEQADALISEAKKLSVDVRLDPPQQPPWNVEHLNIGRNGQVHLQVPAGYDNPSVPKGSVSKPRN